MGNKPKQPIEKPSPERATELGQLLGTDVAAEQVVQVRNLIQIANMPALTLVIHVNQVEGRVAVSAFGAQLTTTQVHRVLDAARAEMVRMEVEAVRAQQPS